MKLQDKPFVNIKNGHKIIEMRLYDEKRQMLKPNDNIQFINLTTGESVLTKIIALHIFKDFSELYAHFEKEKLGYKPNEQALPSDMEQYYSKEEQANYGVVGIEIELIKNFM